MMHFKTIGRNAFPVSRMSCTVLRQVALLVLMVSVWGFVGVSKVDADLRNPTVGAPGFLEDLILPGTELTGQPISNEDSMVVRVVRAIRHGDGYRYEIRFQGLEAGKFDLAKWLIRKDGSATDDLPAIEVEIQSLLPPGQITPNELEMGLIPRLGGYRNVAIGVALLWFVGLLGLIFLGRKKATSKADPETQTTLADLLRDRLQSAASNQIDASQYAELERMLFAMWRRRLGLEFVPAHEALRQVREDSLAGPLMQQLERWLHGFGHDREIDLKTLLEPYQSIPVEEFQAHSSSHRRGPA